MSERMRAVQESDLTAMVALSEVKRLAYQPQQPVFWRKARDSAERQLAFFASQQRRPDVFGYVAEEGSRLTGLLIATVAPAPPVYDPGGLTCMIDDFVVSSSDRWESTGRALLDTARAEARRRGAVQVVVVCGRHDGPKRALLDRLGLTVASEWHVGPS